MESGNGKELESRVASALQNVKHLFPENRSSSSSESPYYDVNHINQNGVGEYRIVSFRYHPDRFVEEPNIVDFEKAFKKYYSEIGNGELEALRAVESPDSITPHAIRLRVLPYKLVKDELKPDEKNPRIIASLDAKDKRIFFGYRKGDAEAKHIISRFMSWYIDGRNKHETAEFVRDLRNQVERNPDSTITYLG